MTTILLEDSWEANDIKEYFQNNEKYKLNELTQEQLYNYDSELFVNSIYFCSTDIVQFHLNKLNIKNIVPDTYDCNFQEFFRRTIDLINFEEIQDYMKSKNKDSVFIKPWANDKSFDGQVYYDNDKFVGPLPNKNDKIYICEKVTFLCEYRLLVGSGKLYGFGFMQGLYSNIKLESISDFINEILLKTNNRYLCIDIGYIKELKKWAIVELNPPFSLDDYNISLNDYIKFCINSCEYIKTTREVFD